MSIKATVVGIESASKFVDGYRRVTLEFAGADAMYRQLRFPERVLGIVGLALDDDLEVEIVPVRREIFVSDIASQAAEGKKP